MKSLKTITGLFFLITLIAINASAQYETPIRIPKCNPVADQIYFVDSGQSVTEVHPGSNGGNGYQLNIIGSGVDKFQVVKEPYMSSLSLVYATDTQAKWQIFFAPGHGQTISRIRIGADCSTRRAQWYQLTQSVVLLGS